MKQIKVCVSGYRHFNDARYIFMVLDAIREVCFENGIIFSELMHGGCRGVDLISKQWAEARGITERGYPADWKAHGRAAGPIRNEEMAAKADLIICFTHELSKGTKGMIRIARRLNIPCEAIDITDRC